ncbi:creatininase family protein [Paenibacillus beijingensis]|uniref:Creatininase n=1 Tax=Paenibacillus beijingensis TaxID=1126833 RepID=A0A0D5NED6_9BACL|nr:creatininase family protein [Paenibacillus beijingensis]AJY73734.1 creatininase [Paenibacillus beijingensis]
MIRQWSNCTTKEIAAIDKERSLVIVPIGATEQHGAHLPVGTDSIILGSLLGELEQRVTFPSHEVLLTPLIPVGKSNEHLDFPGTLTFSTTTMYNMVDDLCGSIRAHGFGKVLLMNSHGGNTDLLNVLSRDLRIKHDMEVYVFDWWFTSFWSDILAKVQQSGEYGVFHACELETSLMLVFRPDLVDMAKAADEFPSPQLTDNRHVSIKGPIVPGWKTQDVSKHGVIGAPTLASAAKGREFIDYAVVKLHEMITEVIGTNYKASLSDEA